MYEAAHLRQGSAEEDPLRYAGGSNEETRAMPDTPHATRSRIFHEIDFDKTGKQLGYLRVPQSRDGGAWSTIEVPIAVINGGKGPAVLFTGGVHGDEYEGQIAGPRVASPVTMASPVTGVTK